MSAALPVQAAQVFRQRRSKLAELLPTTACVLFAGGTRPRNYPANTYPFRADSHFLYLTGASIPDAALVSMGDRAELFVPAPAADDALWHGQVPSFLDIAVATGVDEVRPLGELQGALASLGDASTVASLPCVDPVVRQRQGRLLRRPWTAEELPDQSTWTAADAALAEAMIEIRLVHDEAAIELIRVAARCTEAAHRAGMAVTAPGRREHDVRAAMERELLARGMTTAYGSIITIHGEVLHNTTYQNELGPSDLLLADLGAENHGWATDVTRTWPVNGRFSSTQRALYDIVLQAQRDAIATVKPGVRYRDVHLQACRTLAAGLVDEGILHGEIDSLIERGAHALLFPHGIGHLLGLDVHDMEDLGDRAGYAKGRQRSEQFGLAYLRLDRDLVPGMIVTIEPGIYRVPAILNDPRLSGPFITDGTLDRERLEDFADVRGIRIEDDVLCTANGPVVLTEDIPKEPDEVEDAVGRA